MVVDPRRVGPAGLRRSLPSIDTPSSLRFRARHRRAVHRNLLVATGVFVLVEGLLVFALIRFRHREGRPAPRPTHGHTLMEIAWTLAPAAILVFVAVPTVRTIFATAGEAPADAVKVEVIGPQRWGAFRYQ